MTYEAVQDLVLSGDSSGRESISASRRSMDSLSCPMSEYSYKRDGSSL
jgi:hypothetical protein